MKFLKTYFNIIIPSTEVQHVVQFASRILLSTVLRYAVAVQGSGVRAFIPS
jgi:hypothetical protein